MLNFFKVMRNEAVFVELQLPKSKKNHNFFYPNLFQKTLADLLTNQVNKPLSQLSSTTKKNKKQKIFLILKITKINFSIESNKLAKIKKESEIMQGDLRIC